MNELLFKKSLMGMSDIGGFKSENKFLVCIRCITYNQSAYIADTMDGFVMQQTKFPFVAVIIDDASTDGEQEVIKAYLEEHFDHSQESGFREWETEEAFFTSAQHTENKNCFFVVVYLKKNLFKERDKKAKIIKDWTQTKYIAICEGDDYWTAPNKLQKQVDFLEEHEGVGLCYTDFDFFFEKEQKVVLALFRNGYYRPESFEDHLLARGYIGPMTWMFHRETYEKIRPQNVHTDESFALALEFYYHSNVAYLDEVTATYRFHDDSESRQTDPEKNWRYILGIMETQLEYAKKYGDAKLVEKVYMNNYLVDTLPLAFELNKTEFIKEAENYFMVKGIRFDKFIEWLRIYENKSRQYCQISSSRAYRLGKFLLKPFSWLRRLI